MQDLRLLPVMTAVKSSYGSTFSPACRLIEVSSPNGYDPSTLGVERGKEKKTLKIHLHSEHMVILFSPSSHLSLRGRLVLDLSIQTAWKQHRILASIVVGFCILYAFYAFESSFKRCTFFFLKAKVSSSVFKNVFSEKQSCAANRS